VTCDNAHDAGRGRWPKRPTIRPRTWHTSHLCGVRPHGRIGPVTPRAAPAPASRAAGAGAVAFVP